MLASAFSVSSMGVGSSEAGYVSTACHIQRPITDTLRIGHVLELLDLFISCILHVVGLAHFQRIFVLVHIQMGLIDVKYQELILTQEWSLTPHSESNLSSV